MAVAGLKDTVSDLFSGNPFATEVGHRIEQATDPKLGSENWALFMEICDVINENEESAKDAARAIKKRLHVVMPMKDFDAAQLVLTVLETCVKNCGKRFHMMVCNKDYVSELIKCIGPKYEPPVILQERVLGLIQNWAETFRHSTDVHGVTEVYDELKVKGVEFPMLDFETMAPILTPKQTHATAAPVPQQPTTPRRPVNQIPPNPMAASVQPAVMVGSTPVNPTPEQLAKLRSEVDVVKSNIQVFAEMLTEMKPGQEEPEDMQLLNDLHTTIRSMQDRIVQLLTVVNNEEVTEELLLINDEMNSLFLRFERYERQRKGATVSAIQSRALPKPPTTVQPQENSSTLIDLSENSALNQRDKFDHVQRQMGSMTLRSENHAKETADSDSEDFGAFAQSRVAPTPARTIPTIPVEIPRENELNEMESWLKAQPQSQPTTATDRPSLSSSEFDKFLESRAVAAEQLPNINTIQTANQKDGSQKKEEKSLLDS